MKLVSTVDFWTQDYVIPELKNIRGIHLTQSLCIVTLANEIRICTMNSLKTIKVLLPS